MTQILAPCGLTSGKRPPPVSRKRPHLDILGGRLLAGGSTLS